MTEETNIVFDNTKPTKPPKPTEYDVYGYPTNNKPWNTLWDVQHQFPVYTKTNKSKSWFAAGWYNVKKGRNWQTVLAPKLILLQRYPHSGPFYTKEEVKKND